MHVPSTDGFVDRKPGCNSCRLADSDIRQLPLKDIHLNDSVTVDTGAMYALFRIGRVVGLGDGAKVKVQWYGRMSELAGNEQNFLDPVSRTSSSVSISMAT